MQNTEEALARAVIFRAIEDVFQSKKGVIVAIKDGVDADEARCFLTSTDGVWRKTRELWCSIANVDPNALTEEIDRRYYRYETKSKESASVNATQPQRKSNTPHHQAAHDGGSPDQHDTRRRTTQ